MRSLRLIPLEERIVLDAAIAHDAAAFVAEASQPVENPNVVVVNNAIDDPNTLVDALQDDTILIYYDFENTTLDELSSQIQNALGSQKAESIAFITEGAPGRFELVQNVSITTTTLQPEVENGAIIDFWNSVASNLAPEGSVDIFGCRVASNEFGVQLVQNLEAILNDVGTNISVNASTDDTGDAALGGDWILEYSDDLERNVVEIYFEPAALENWNEILAVTDNFSARFAGTAQGDITLIGNTVLIESPATATTNITGDNQDVVMKLVDVDSDSSTFNSSSATLDLPSGSDVLFAGLYWSADTSAANGAQGTAADDASLRGTVLIDTPEPTGYISITADELHDDTANGAPYLAYKDITSIVLAAGEGEYTIANVQAGEGKDDPGMFGGWSMVVVYRNGNEPFRDLMVYDGYAYLDSPSFPSMNVNVSGFNTPTTGALDVKIGAVAFEGDAGIADDALKVDGTAIGDALTPTDNFFNSQITLLGSHFTDKDFNFEQNQGIDVKLVDASSEFTNGQNSATVTFESSGDEFFAGVLTMSTTTEPPDFTISDGEIFEGQSGEKEMVFTVTLSEPLLSSISIDYETQNGTATTGDNDYDSQSGTITFDPGETVQTISIDINGDDDVESDETFFVNLLQQNSPFPGNISDGIGLGLIKNDDGGRDPELVFTTNESGAITLIGNTILAPNGSIGSSDSNNDHDMLNVDVDSDPNTFNSSTATLTLPSGVDVLYAGLVWSADLDTEENDSTPVSSEGQKIADQVWIMDPTSGTYQTVVADAFNVIPNERGNDYSGFVDVTSIVQQGGNGDYTIANIQAATGEAPGGGAHGGWALVVVYGDESLPVRNLSVFNGFGIVSSGTGDVSTTVTGFLTPTGGDVNTILGAVAFEGESEFSGDRLEVDGNSVGNTLNPSNNFFNGSITTLDGNGNPIQFTDKDPNQRNNLGVDIDLVDASSEFGNQQTTAEITFTTNNDLYFPTILTFQTDMRVANVTLEKTVENITPGRADGEFFEGDTLRFTIIATNDGLDRADNVVITDPIPEFTTYVGGTLVIGGTSKTDAIPDDEAYFDISLGDDGTVVFNIGNHTGGADPATEGGFMNPGTSITVMFDVTIDSDLTGDITGSNTATVSFISRDIGEPFENENPDNGDADFPIITNEAPDADDDSYSVLEDGSIVNAQSVLVNDDDPEDDPLTAILQDDVSSGSLTFRSDGTFDYTPNANFNGTDTFTYVANDGDANSNVATVTITVDPVNDAPVAEPDQYSTDEDTQLVVNAANGVLDNDSDIDNSANELSAVLVSDVSDGTLQLNSDGSFTYDPDLNFNGTDSFTYKVNDGAVDGNTVTVTLEVAPINDPPVAEPDQYSTDEDTQLVVNAANGVLSNDTDVDNPPGDLKAFIVSTTSNGNLTLNEDGSFTYDPDANFNGTDSFEYKVNDGDVDGNTVTVTIAVDPINDPPVAQSDSYNVIEDTQLVVNAANGVLDNDTDTENNQLTAILVSDVSNGTLNLAADGSFTYNPDANFNGIDTFTYKPNDGVEDGNTVTVTLDVQAVNDPAVAVDDSYTTSEDTQLVVSAADGVLDNDTDTENNQLTAVLVDDVSNGTLVLNGDGSFTYTPGADFNGTDSFTYYADDGPNESNIATVTITVDPVNDPPIAEPDQYSTDEDTQLVVNAANGVLDNDSDIDNSANELSAVLVSNVSNGTLQLNSDGSFTYDPDANFNGIDTFTYKPNDGVEDGNTVTVTIEVDPINDPPVAEPDQYSTDEDTQLVVNTASGVLSNDTDIDNPSGDLKAFIVSTTSNGNLTLNEDGSFTYDPDLNFNGTDSFTYKVNDGIEDGNTVTVTLDVAPINDPPVAEPDQYSTDEDTQLVVNAVNGVLSNDTDVDNPPGDLKAFIVSTTSNGNLTLNEDGSFTYDPDENFNGTDSFEYKVNDGAIDGNTVTVTITVDPVNDPPVAQSDSYNAIEDTQLVVNAANGVLDNDTDTENNQLTAILVSDVSNGTLNLAADGSFTYDPDANFNGIDTFTYKPNDGVEDGNTVTVTLDVQAVNDPAVAVDDSYTTSEDAQLVVSAADGVLDNDTDTENNQLTAVLVDDVSNGTLVLNGDGSFTYTPGADFNGTDSFTYYADDGPNESNIATVTITVDPVNDPPIAEPDQYSTDEDTQLVVNAANGVLDNDSDIDNSANELSAVLVSNVSNGILQLNSDGSFTYDPDANFNGIDSFTYKPNDGVEDGNTVTVTIEVDPINDPPVAENDEYATDEDTQLVVDAANGVLANDTDIDSPHSSLEAFLATNVSNGLLILETDGSFTYTPDANFFGTDSFTYVVNDGEAGGNTATVEILVGPVNDIPIADPDNYTTQEDTPLIVNALNGVLANDQDIENHQLYAELDTGVPANQGILDLNEDGSFVFTPAANYNGTVTFTYTVTDRIVDPKSGPSSPLSIGTVTIVVTPVNDAPVANPDSYTLDEGVLIGPSSVLNNDTDAHNGAPNENHTPLSAQLVTTTSNGVLVFNPDGTFTYTPNPGFDGVDSFTYATVDSQRAVSNPTTVTIDVEPVVAAPPTPTPVDPPPTSNDPTPIPVSGISAPPLQYDPNKGVITAHDPDEGKKFTFSTGEDIKFTYGTTKFHKLLITEDVINKVEHKVQSEAFIMENDQITFEDFRLFDSEKTEQIPGAAGVVVSYGIATILISANDLSISNLRPDRAVVAAASLSGARIRFTPISSMAKRASGDKATFTISLALKPASEVYIDLRSSNTAAGILSPDRIIFTPSNWDKPQTVNLVEGAHKEQFYTILATVTSQDPNYNGLNPESVAVESEKGDGEVAMTPTTEVGSGKAGDTINFNLIMKNVSSMSSSAMPFMQQIMTPDAVVSPTSLMAPPTSGPTPLMMESISPPAEIGHSAVSFSERLGMSAAGAGYVPSSFTPSADGGLFELSSVDGATPFSSYSGSMIHMQGGLGGSIEIPDGGVVGEGGCTEISGPSQVSSEVVELELSFAPETGQTLESALEAIEVAEVPVHPMSPLLKAPDTKIVEYPIHQSWRTTAAYWGLPSNINPMCD